MDATLSQRPWSAVTSAEVKIGPGTGRNRVPLFIGDAVTPWGRDTVLLALLRAETQEKPNPQPPD